MVATIRYIEENDLPRNAAVVGAHLRQRLTELQEKYEKIGDVRGMGLMQAIELVKDRATKEPDPQSAARLLEATRKRSLLVGKGGTYGNALRIAPPMIVTRGEVDDALRILADALEEALRR